MQGTFPAYALSHSICNSPFLCFRGLIFIFLYTVPHSIKLFGLLYVIQHYFCASTLYAHISNFRLMTSLMSSSVPTCLKISLIMSLSFSPPMNCSISSLSYSLYSNSVAFSIVYPSSHRQTNLFTCVIYGTDLT